MASSWYCRFWLGLPSPLEGLNLRHVVALEPGGEFVRQLLACPCCGRPDLPAPCQVLTIAHEILPVRQLAIGQASHSLGIRRKHHHGVEEGARPVPPTQALVQPARHDGALKVRVQHEAVSVAGRIVVMQVAVGNAADPVGAGMRSP